MQSIFYKTKEEIALIEESAQLVSRTLGMLAAEIKEGVRLLELDKMAFEFIKDHNAEPGFLGLYGFPNTLCTSLNEVVAHGIPDTTVLKEGDIISIDCGVKKNGFYGDHAFTFSVGEISKEKKLLCETTKESLYLAIKELRVGNRLGDVGNAIAKHAKKKGLRVIKELIGHGIGRDMHESPNVPNFGKPGEGPLIYEGLVIAIEPMLNLGKRYIKKPRDGWNIKTADLKPSAHYEHNVAVVDGQPKILSTFKYIEEALSRN